MARKGRPKLGRSPLPPKTGGAHKSPFDYDRSEWKKRAEEEEEEIHRDETADVGRSARTGRSEDVDRSRGADHSSDVDASAQRRAEDGEGPQCPDSVERLDSAGASDDETDRGAGRED